MSSTVERSGWTLGVRGFRGFLATGVAAKKRFVVLIFGSGFTGFGGLSALAHIRSNLRRGFKTF